MLQAMTLCNDSSIDEGKTPSETEAKAGNKDPQTKSGKAIIGDPTETALVDYALSIGTDKGSLKRNIHVKMSCLLTLIAS